MNKIMKFHYQGLVDDIGKDEVISFSFKGKDLSPGDTLKKTSVIDFKLGNGKL